MIKEASITRVECPACGYRLFDKGVQACGPVQTKCTRCKRVLLNSRQMNLNKLAENQKRDEKEIVPHHELQIKSTLRSG